MNNSLSLWEEVRLDKRTKWWSYLWINWLSVSCLVWLCSVSRLRQWLSPWPRLSRWPWIFGRWLRKVSLLNAGDSRADWLKASFTFCPWKAWIVDALVDFPLTLCGQSGFLEGIDSHVWPWQPQTAWSCVPLGRLGPVTLGKVFIFPPSVRLRAVFFYCLADKSKKARTCCSCAASAGQKEVADAQCAAGSKTFFFSPLLAVVDKMLLFGERLKELRKCQSVTQTSTWAERGTADSLLSLYL